MTQDELLELIDQAAREGWTELNLQNQGITELPPEIGRLTTLEKLNLGYDWEQFFGEINILWIISAETSRLVFYRDVRQNSNRLKTLPPEIGQLTALQELNLNDNQLISLPPEIGKLANLRELDLRNNQLKTLPSEIGQLILVQKLNLGNNRLETLPPEIGQMASLREIFLWHNKLTTLPPEIVQLTALRYLQLGGNNLTVIPPEIIQLTSLQVLSLYDNQLTALPPEIGQLTNLQELYLSGNGLTTFPSEIIQLTALRSLNLGKTGLTVLPQQIVQLVTLQELCLWHNKLTTFPLEVIQLTALQKLNLNGNQLTTLPPEIGQLVTLQELNLAGNQLTTLPPEIGQLVALRELDLSNNQLTTLPSEIVQLTTLQALSLNDNKLTVFPKEICQLTNLQALGINNSQLTSLPPEIGQLTALKILSLDDNHLTTLPKEISQLTALQLLSLNSNQLAAFPLEIMQLTALQFLFLNRNQLTVLPHEISQLTALQFLSLNNNQLRSLPSEIEHLVFLQYLFLRGNFLIAFPREIDQLTALQSLDLSGVGLTSLPPEIAQLTALQELDVSSNQLSTLFPEATQLIALRSLNLSENQLAFFPQVITQLTSLWSLNLHSNQLTILPPEIGQLIDLQSLDLSENRLTILPSEIGQLVALKELRLGSDWIQNNKYNQLTALPPEIGQLNALEILTCSGTPLRTPPPEIVARGKEEILAFLRALLVGATTRREAKLLLVGEGGTGKSSLLRALQGLPFDKDLSSTHGIDIQPYPLPHPHQPGEIITLNIWDFGGQQIYHTTHQFFLTRRSLYLLIWNARGDTDQARLDHWLRNVQAVAPEAPVILVATHIDERPVDFNFQRYKAVYPQLVDPPIGVSNLTGAGIADLKDLIARVSVALPLMEQQWPTAWCQVEQAIREHPAAHITRAAYTELCTACGVTSSAAQDALGGYLHDLGKILYYQDDETLCDFVILKPNWLTQATSLVLDDDQVRLNGGILPHAAFPRIWRDYDRSLYPRFRRLIERFLISFQLPPEHPQQPPTHSLVPLRLHHQPPAGLPPWAEVLPDLPEINMRLTLTNFTPPGLMSWFIVLTHRYTQSLHWREGVRLAYDGQQAEVVFNPSLGELWLRVRGRAPYNFFNILHHTLIDRILNFYTGLTYRREIPCNCHRQREDTTPCVYFHDYERLVARMEAGRQDVECDESFERVSVPELLFGIHPSTNDRVEAQLDQIHESIHQEHRETRTAVQQGDQELAAQLTTISQGFESLCREFTRLWNFEMAQLQAECPNTFVLMPGDRRALDPRRVFGSPYTLYLLCQHPGGPHIVKGESGYPVNQPHEWWRELAPWLKRLSDYLRYIPKVRAVAEAYDEDVFKAIDTSLDIFKAVLDIVPEKITAADPLKHLSDSRSQFATTEATGAALRALSRFLQEADPKNHWCNLEKVVTGEGSILWLCPEHRKEHRI